MLSREELADTVKGELENLVKKGEIDTYFSTYYYILFDGKIYPGDNYDEEVKEGKHSTKDIYAQVSEFHSSDFDDFLFHINHLEVASVADIVYAYLRKVGFTIEYFPPTPNLKYFISAEVKLNNDTPEYLGIDIYDINTLARSFRIPQVVEQKLGSNPRKITLDDAFDIRSIVVGKQPLLVGHTYWDTIHILLGDFLLHEKKYKEEARKLALAYMNLFPKPYEVCYEWGAGIFIKIDCLKLELRSFSS